MRLALILASNYESNSRYAVQPACALAGDLLEDRLAEPDARFAIQRVRSSRKLKSRLARALTAAAGGETLFFFSGYAALVDDEPKLVLDDPRGGLFAAQKLRELLGPRSGAALIVLDLVHKPDTNLSIEFVEAFREDLRGEDPDDALGSRLSLLVAARPAGEEASGPPVLTRLLLQALESHERGALDCAQVYTRMRADPAFESLPAVGFFPAKDARLSLLLPPVSEAPTSVRQAPSSDPDAPVSSRRLGTPPPKPSKSGQYAQVRAPEPSVRVALDTAALASAAASAPISGSAPSSGPISGSAPSSGPISGSAPSSGPISGSAPSSGPVSASAPSSARASAAPPPDPAALIAAGQYDAALAEYKKQLLRLGGKRGAAHAQVFVGMARAKALLGKAEEALHNYDKALSITPLDAAVFSEAKALVLAGGDIERLADWVRRRADNTSDRAVKAQSLLELGRIWIEHQDYRRAITALEAACSADPASPLAHQELAGAFEHMGRPAQAIRALSAAAEAEPDLTARADLLIRAAKLAHGQLEGGEEVLELSRRALEASPLALTALELTSEVLAGRRRFAELARVYEQALERTPPGPVAFEVSKRLGLLYRDQLDEIEGAKRSFQRALDSDPAALELYYWVSELYEAEQQYVPAARQFQLAARFHTEDTGVYRRALWLFEKAGDTDAAWNAAVALESLGEADINESLLADQHRPDGPIAPQRGLSRERWQAAALGRSREDEPGLSAVFAAVQRAALSLASQHSQRAPWLEGAARQEPDSTASLVRSLGWAARLLGVDAPELWIRGETSDEPSQDVGVRVLPGAGGALATRVVASSRLSSGLGPAELGFMWGRSLAGLVNPFQLADVFANDTELGRLLLAALALGGAHGVELDDHAEQLAEQLEELLEEDELSALTRAVSALAVKQTVRQLGQWRRRLSLGRSRVGLLLAGDLAQASALAERFPLPGATAAEVVSDLRAFSISEPYLSLRQDLGIAVE